MSSPTGHGSFPCTGCIPDTINGAKFVRDLYDLHGPHDLSKFTVPILWDKKTKKVVSNESSEIIVMLNEAFNAVAKNPDLDLNPADLRVRPLSLGPRCACWKRHATKPHHSDTCPLAQEEMAAVDKWIYPGINDGVYRCGFSTTQQAYEEAFDSLFAALDRADGILAKQRYIAGDRLTLSDIRLWMTLIRFDPVYVVYFKTNKKRIDEYPNLFNYVKEIWQVSGVVTRCSTTPRPAPRATCRLRVPRLTAEPRGQIPEVKASTDLGHIKTHYFSSHPRHNFYSIIPKGNVVDLDAPHDRERLPKSAK